MIPSQIAKSFPSHTPTYSIDKEVHYDYMLLYITKNEIVFMNREEYYLWSHIDTIVNISNIDIIVNRNIDDECVVLVVDDEYVEYKERIYGVIFDKTNYIQFTKQTPTRWSREEDCVLDINNDTFVYQYGFGYYTIPHHLTYNEKREDGIYVCRVDKTHKDYKEMYDYDGEWEERDFAYVDIKSDMRDYSRYRRDIGMLFVW